MTPKPRKLKLAGSLTFWILPALLPIHADIIQGPILQISVEEHNQWAPSVAYNALDDEYLVVRHEGSPLSEIWGTRLDSQGSVIDQFLISAGDRNRSEPTVAFDPGLGRYLVVWVYDYFGDGSDLDIQGRLIPRTGPDASLVAFTLNDNVSDQLSPRIAYNDTEGEFFVVWFDSEMALWQSYGQRVNAANGALVGSVQVISSTSFHHIEPDVTYLEQRNEYFVVYKRENSGGEIWGRRVSATGGLGGEFEISGAADQAKAPRVSASNSSDHYGVTWVSDTGAVAAEDVFARRITGAGVLVGDPLLIGGTTVNESNPDIETHPDKDSFLIAWSQQYSNLSGYFGIRARNLDSSGNLGPTFDPMPVFTGSNVTSSSAAVAAGPGDWLVTWTRRREDFSWFDIYGRLALDRIFADGFESGNTNAWSAVAP